MQFFERQSALKRAYALLEQDPRFETHRAFEQEPLITENTPTETLALKLFQAGLNIPPLLVLGAALVLGFVLTALLAYVLSPFLLPFVFLCGCLIPFSYIESRRQHRATEFGADYPTVLLATASSMKIGMTPYTALERSVRLLPHRSLVRKEVESLLSKLRKGVAKEEAIAQFGSSIAQPDLPLFRAAFLLVSEHGGKFTPTLQRLATVCRDRALLISNARVSTANMRMTANILLGVTPAIIGVIAFRTPNFWNLFLHHPVANFLASTGLVIIGSNYALLRKMSNFKP